MKAIALAATVACILASGAASADDAMAPVRTFVDSLNKGDAKTAATAFVPNAPIIDEFAPHHWGSFDSWFADFAADAKKRDVTDVHVTLRRATTSTVGATDAYLVVPNTISGKIKGHAGSERGIFTFALTKTAQGWRIASWAWAKQ